ncbi:hypothetical protein LJ207_09800 [Halanaerobium sp. Z-7514]|uniref:Uncharacterized protein n=1 Tax=Halanaerobium polyolivorans TaxID=2886943 RepID=A0AAW4X1C3_9FIRM|nr:hypothetical protein [Halanaerobium polyolivorans]MCC3145616.1 hypothetical protein [Halanaerobium polyolivorans]RQD73742.1 MAG: hypothetical protein D5S01_07535 [Halanaerobium sp. MSAO_Bac5]
MISYKLDNYLEQLNKQVISMDQGLAYNPEFRATKKMHDYPSRKAQLIRSLYYGELEASPYNAEIIFKSLLSRQGERWQNFGESPEDYTDIMILGRELLNKSGVLAEKLEKIEQLIKANNGHLLDIEESEFQKYKEKLPQSADSTTYLFIDDQTLKYIPHSLEKLGRFFSSKDIVFSDQLEHHFPGWEYFVYGFVEAGKKHLEELFAELEDKNIKEIITISGQSQYLLNHFADKLAIEHNFRIINILDILEKIKAEQSLYLYAGSFYTRYLNYSNKINNLADCNQESKIKAAVEFLPLYRKGARLNQVNIWQFPLCAEYELFLFPEELRTAILEDGLKQIQRSIHKKLLLFDPYAYQALKNYGYEEEFVYFTDLIEVW